MTSAAQEDHTRLISEKQSSKVKSKNPNCVCSLVCITMTHYAGWFCAVNEGSGCVVDERRKVQSRWNCSEFAKEAPIHQIELASEAARRPLAGDCKRTGRAGVMQSLHLMTCSL